MAIRLHNCFRARSAKVPYWNILDELSYLEGGARPTSTKPAEPFRGEVLGRFMHKHYSGTAFMAKNLDNQWFGPYAQKNGVFGKALESISLSGSEMNEEEAWKWAGQIAHTVVIDGMKRLRNRKQMTGEWIIYYVHEGRNYYLDIAWHTEDEQRLHNRLKAQCAWEFPFAFEE